jgi:hypothetical protein
MKIWKNVEYLTDQLHRTISVRRDSEKAREGRLRQGNRRLF